MPRQRRLESIAPWVELSTTATDWKNADPELLAAMLGQLHLIRAFEERVLELAGEGLVHGPAHSSIGQEGGAVGSIVGLRTTDAVNGSHRGHHQFLAKAITHVSQGKLDLTNLVDDTLQNVLQRTLAEILGLSQGFCAGRGGSMHLQWFEAGALGTNAIVGGGAPMATGNAYAQKHSGTTDLTINYFGDGAAQIGSVLESMNLAAAWKLPVCFFVENNFYAVSTRIEESVADTRLSVRGQGFGIPSWKVDGMDPLAVHLAMEQAAEVMRSGGGPAVVEAEVYRFFHQNGPYPGSAFGYRDKEEEAEWKKRDPLERVAREMIKLGTSMRRACSVRDQALAPSGCGHRTPFSKPTPKSRAKRAHPPPSCARHLTSSRGCARFDASGSWRRMTCGRAAHRYFAERESLKFRRRRSLGRDGGAHVSDDRIRACWGGHRHRLKGGNETARPMGLADSFPDRVLGTPISENAFAGHRRRGLALDGRFRARHRVHVSRLTCGSPPTAGLQPRWQGAAHVSAARTLFRSCCGTKGSRLGSGYGLSTHDPAGIFGHRSAGWRNRSRRSTRRRLTSASMKSLL